MRAIVLDRTGGPEVLEVREIDEPDPSPDEVVVDVEVAGVNFIDIYLRSGLYPTSLPTTPGKEGAGVVATVGSGVTDFAPGDRVAWAMGGGSYAQRAVVGADILVGLPDGVPTELAAAVMLQGMTAHFLSESIVALHAHDTVLVHAGAGGVGLLLTQLLARQGVRVITTTSTPEKARRSRESGAAEVIDYTVDDVAATVRDLTGGTGVRAVYDGVGASTFDASLNCLQARGTMILFGGSSGPVPPIDPQVLNAKGSLMLTRPSLAHFVADRDELQWRADSVLGLVGSGDLDVHIGATYELADAAQAHTDLAERRTSGKLLIRP